MCRLCDEGFDQIHVLRQHSVCHADPVTGTYACPWCHKTFDMYGTARRHARAFHSQTHSCPDCGKTFPRPDKLKLHRLRHSTHREFMCENCGRQFKRKVGSALRFFTRSRFATFRESPGKCGNIREFRSGRGDVSARSAHRSVFFTRSRFAIFREFLGNLEMSGNSAEVGEMPEQGRPETTCFRQCDNYNRK